LGKHKRGSRENRCEERGDPLIFQILEFFFVGGKVTAMKIPREGEVNRKKNFKTKSNGLLVEGKGRVHVRG